MKAWVQEKENAGPSCKGPAYVVRRAGPRYCELGGAIGNVCAVDPRCNAHDKFPTASGVVNSVCMLAARNFVNETGENYHLVRAQLGPFGNPIVQTVQKCPPLRSGKVLLAGGLQDDCSRVFHYANSFRWVRIYPNSRNLITCRPWLVNFRRLSFSLEVKESGSCRLRKIGQNRWLRSMGSP